MQIVTGKTGTNHVKAEHDRAKHAGTFGTGEYVLNTGSGLKATIEASDTIRLGSGAGMMQGTLFCIEHGTHDDVTIDNGTTGYMRKDLIVAEYNKVADIESVLPVVIKGEPSESEPQTPEYTHANILEGATYNQMPLYEVLLDGVNIVSVTPLFKMSTGLDDVYRKKEVDSIKNTLQEGINTAQSTANNGVANAATAQRTADDAMAEAEEADIKANSAMTKAEKAQSTADDAVDSCSELSAKVQTMEQEIALMQDQIAQLMS